MKKVNFCALIDSNFDATLKSLKENLGLANNADVIHALFAFYENPFKSGLSPKQRIEKFVQSLLISKTEKINTHTIKIHFIVNENGYQPNVNTVKEVLELYSEEIAAHNAKF